MKMLVFKGIGSEDPKKLWFVVNAPWTMQKITDDNLKKAQLAMPLQGRVLTWYIKLCQDRHGVTLAEIQ